MLLVLTPAAGFGVVLFAPILFLGAQNRHSTYLPHCGTSPGVGNFIVLRDVEPGADVRATSGFVI